MDLKKESRGIAERKLAEYRAAPVDVDDLADDIFDLARRAYEEGLEAGANVNRDVAARCHPGNSVQHEFLEAADRILSLKTPAAKEKAWGDLGE